MIAEAVIASRDHRLRANAAIQMFAKRAVLFAAESIAADDEVSATLVPLPDHADLPHVLDFEDHDLTRSRLNTAPGAASRARTA